MAKLPALRMKTPEELAELRRRSEGQSQVRTATHSVCDRIDPERAARIRKAVADADIQLLSSLSDPLELHLFASSWNGDRGPAPLLQIVQHAFCDAGTALWLYWENDPEFYSHFRSEADADDDETRIMLKLSRTIEDRFQRGDFASSVVSFDPQFWRKDRNPGPTGQVHEIPKIMNRPTPTS